VRFWDRVLDTFFYFNLITFLLFLLQPLSYPLLYGPYLGFFAIFFWIFLESLLLKVAGTTPGKWLLRVGLKKANGDALGLEESLIRSASVWFRGLGIGGIAIIVPFTMGFSYCQLMSGGGLRTGTDTNALS